VYAATANEEPTVHILSAGMRAGTTLMDVTYRIDDPDDATVSVQALAFVDGVRSFANVIRPTTWAEGTESNLGSNITTDVEHSLTWDVAADMTNDLVHLKFEVLCRDSRGLLPLEWITIPAAGGHDELTISKNAPTDGEVLDALFWEYAEWNPRVRLLDGWLIGTSASMEFNGVPLVDASEVQDFGPAHVLRSMNLLTADERALNEAIVARSDLGESNRWHAVHRPYQPLTPLVTWGDDFACPPPPMGLTNVVAIACTGTGNILLTQSGTVHYWGADDSSGFGTSLIPGDLTNATAIAASWYHCLALTESGHVVGWGGDDEGQASPPEDLTNAIAIAAGRLHSVALTEGGEVVVWGWGENDVMLPPPGLSTSNVTALAAGANFTLALTADGNVVGWGDGGIDEPHRPPEPLTNAAAIAAGFQHALALTVDGEVVGWGSNGGGEASPPADLPKATAIAANCGETDLNCSIALTEHGTVVGWGIDRNKPAPMPQTTPPPGLSNVVAIAAGSEHALALLGSN